MFEANLSENLTLSLQNLWSLSAMYLLVSTISAFLIPRYNLQKFLLTPKVKHHTIIGKIGYYLLLALPVFMPFSSLKLLEYTGVIVFFIGILIYLAGIFYFSISEHDKFADEGIFRIFKHPVYVGFFVILLGISFASGSVIYLAFSILYFFNNRVLQKSEEKYCVKKYGQDYENYIKHVKF